MPRLPPVVVSLELHDDLNQVLDESAPTLTMSAIVRRILRAGMIAEGHALTEDRTAIAPNEWPRAWTAPSVSLDVDYTAPETMCVCGRPLAAHIARRCPQWADVRGENGMFEPAEVTP